MKTDPTFVLSSNVDAYSMEDADSAPLEITEETSQNYPASNRTCWRKQEPALVESTFTGKQFSDIDDTMSPLKYYKMFFDDTLIEHITEQTNLYHIQESLAKGLKDKCASTIKYKIEHLIGILIYMGIHPNPQYRMYWSTSTQISQITRALKGG